jgi:hypothetical protein
MIEREINQNSLIFDGDPFAKDFNKNLNAAIRDEVKKTVVKGSAKAVACAIPFALSSCSNLSPDTVHLNLDGPSTYGLVSGGLWAVEEAFEKSDKKFFRKSVAIASKFGAGFIAGHAITSNLKDNNWVSAEHLTNTISLIPAAYVIVRETSISELINGLTSGAERAVSGVKESRKIRDQRRELEHLAKDVNHRNMNIQSAARTKAEQMGISMDQLRQIRNQTKR